MKIIELFARIDIPRGDLDPPKGGDIGSTSIAAWLSYVFAIAGGVAMIVIVIAGMQFMLGQGDPSKSANARNTIIYAAVGLALAAGAFAAVRFVAGSV